MLKPDAVHPKLEKKYDQVLKIVQDKPGFFGEHDLLYQYLTLQVDLLKTRDVMFAHDLCGAPQKIMSYAKGEMQELAQEIPELSDKVESFDSIAASGEAGDVLWFLSMRIALSHLDKRKRISLKEGREIAGLMKFIDGVSEIYPSFNPSKVAKSVKEKVDGNYPDRVLRESPKTSIETMSRIFDTERKVKLRHFRNMIPGGKIPPVIHQSIQLAQPVIPKGVELKRGGVKAYRDVIVYAREASNYYSY